VRRGQFEGLREAVSRNRRGGLTWRPGLHPTPGLRRGARKFLVEYNIYFDSTDVAMVRQLPARFVRLREV